MSSVMRDDVKDDKDITNEKLSSSLSLLNLTPYRRAIEREIRSL